MRQGSDAGASLSPMVGHATSPSLPVLGESEGFELARSEGSCVLGCSRPLNTQLSSFPLVEVFLSPSQGPSVSAKGSGYGPLVTYSRFIDCREGSNHSVVPIASIQMQNVTTRKKTKKPLEVAHGELGKWINPTVSLLTLLVDALSFDSPMFDSFGVLRVSMP